HQFQPESSFHLHQFQPHPAFYPQPALQQQLFQAPQQSVGTATGLVDDTFGGSEYHYSWRHDGNRKYTWGQANRYCRGLSGGWQPISIESAGENDFVTKVVQGELLKYIWTGATQAGLVWSWPSGGAFNGIAWSHTGGASQPQPDNREQGGENCLAVLNNFYNDGVKWHDIACSHLKPVICERK
ncbi:unnamed protein product, partial [Meganyctiphanes norvegica]